MSASLIKIWTRLSGVAARTTCVMSTAERRIAPPFTCHPSGTLRVNAPSRGSRHVVKITTGSGGLLCPVALALAEFCSSVDCAALAAGVSPMPQANSNIKKCRVNRRPRKRTGRVFIVCSCSHGGRYRNRCEYCNPERSGGWPCGDSHLAITRGGLKGSMQHWLAVYPPEFQIPMFFVAVD